jgi:hypothetical protein
LDRAVIEQQPHAASNLARRAARRGTRPDAKNRPPGVRHGDPANRRGVHAQLVGHVVGHGAVHRGHQLREQPGPAGAVQARAAQLGQHALECAAIGVKAQPVSGGVFQMVRLVDHQVLVLGQHVPAGDHVREQQRVIDDQDVRAFGGLARAPERARPAQIAGAAIGRAALGIGRNAAPGELLAGAEQRQLGAVAGLRGRQPDQQLRQQAHFLRAAHAAVPQSLEPPRAQVVGAALEHGRAELERQAAL